MRSLSAVLLSAALAAQTKVRGVADVITMLEKMLKDNTANVSERNKIYDEAACDCKDTLTTLEHRFRDQQRDLTNARDEQRTVKKELDDVTKELDFFIRLELDGSEEEKAVNLKYLRDEIDTAKGNLASEQASCNKQVQDCDMMIKACNQVVDFLRGPGGKPTVVELVRTLKERALKRKAALQGSEGMCGAKIRGLEKQIGSDSTSYKISMENAAELSANKDAKQARWDELEKLIGELETAQTNVRDQVKKKDDFCQQTKSTFDADSDLMQAEIVGLKGAIKALKKVPQFLDVSFIQTRTMESSVESALSHIAGAALISRSKNLSALALRIQSKSIDEESKAFFKDVREMIKNMWNKLEDEQEREATREQTCKTDLSDGLDKKQAAQRATDAAVTATKMAVLDYKEAQKQREDKEADISDAEAALTEAKKLRAEAVEFNTQKHADKEAGIEGLETALKFLNKVYGQESQSGESYGARKNMGSDVLTKLNGILDEYKCDFAEASANLACASGDTYAAPGKNTDHACVIGFSSGTCSFPEPETYEYKSEIDYQTGILGREEKPQSGYYKDLTDLKADEADRKQDVQDRKGEQTDEEEGLDGAIKALRLVQEACVNQADQFKARVKQREQEIAALKEALEILESHSKNSEKFDTAKFMFLAAH